MECYGASLRFFFIHLACYGHFKSFWQSSSVIERNRALWSAIKWWGSNIEQYRSMQSAMEQHSMLWSSIEWYGGSSCFFLLLLAFSWLTWCSSLFLTVPCCSSTFFSVWVPQNILEALWDSKLQMQFQSHRVSKMFHCVHHPSQSPLEACFSPTPSEIFLTLALASIMVSSQ